MSSAYSASSEFSVAWVRGCWIYYCGARWRVDQRVTDVRHSEGEPGERPLKQPVTIYISL